VTPVLGQISVDNSRLTFKHSGIVVVVVGGGDVVVVVGIVVVVVDVVVVVVGIVVVVVGQSGISFTFPVSTHLLSTVWNWQDSGEQK
jgi:hypothetical protein